MSPPTDLLGSASVDKLRSLFTADALRAFTPVGVVVVDALARTGDGATRRRTGLLRSSADVSNGSLLTVEGIVVAAAVVAAAVPPNAVAVRWADEDRTGDVRRATGDLCEAIVR